MAKGSVDPNLAAVRSYLDRATAAGFDGSSVIEFTAAPEAAKKAGQAWGSALSEKFDIDGMNAEFAFVMIGKAPMIFWDRPDVSEHGDCRFITLTGFREMSANSFEMMKGGAAKPKRVTHADRWLTSKDRRDYAGIEFYPDPANRGGRASYLNLWRGFSAQPSATGSYAVFRDHLLTNVCDGDAAAFQWLFGWFAQMVQQPRMKPGTAVVMRGGMGTGKTIVGKIVGSLISSHYVIADDPRYVAGNFNTHMAACLLLQLDEALWAGDKQAEGRLKGLITSTEQMIEGKGVDPVKVDNHLRVMMTSNSDWVVPAGKDERRFAIFDVAPHCAQNNEYFAEMEAEIESGGRERLLHDLLTFDLSTVNLRTIPKTSGLLEQKIHSLDPIEAWLLERLQDGEPTRGHGLWPPLVKCERVIDDYLASADRIGIHRKATATQFGIKLRKLLPSIRKRQATIPTEQDLTTERARVYDLPPLDQARSEFEAALGQPIEWDGSG